MHSTGQRASCSVLFVPQGEGIQPEDMQALLDYLSSVPNVSNVLCDSQERSSHHLPSLPLSLLLQEENLHDVLDLLLALVFEDSHHPGNIVQMFYDQGGLKLEEGKVLIQKFKIFFQCGCKTLGMLV